MTRVILTTVGTSLKGNAERTGRPGADLLREDPAKASAEANVLVRLLTPGDRVELFHSQTEDGEMCALAVRDWVRGRGHAVEMVPIEGLTYRAADFHRGMRSFVRCLTGRIRAIRRAGDEPVLNALGGFKPEVAYATLVGALFGIPNVYIHQGFDELLTISPLPVGWDVAAIDPYADILDWLDEEPRTAAAARSRLAQVPDGLRESMIEADGDGVYLSPLGEAYFEAYRARVEAAVEGILLSVAAANSYAGAEPTQRAAFDRMLSRLRVPEIRRSGSKTLERDHGDSCVFPRGHVDERAFWHEAGDGIVHVLEITRHGREYDRLYSRGVQASDYEDGGWTPWTPPAGL